MQQESKTETLPGFNPDYHFQPGATVDFANRIVTGTCYNFAAGEELKCPRCGGGKTRVVSPPGGPVRCNDGAIARDAAITKCLDCGSAYIWRICED